MINHHLFGFGSEDADPAGVDALAENTGRGEIAENIVVVGADLELSWTDGVFDQARVVDDDLTRQCN